MNNSFVTLLPYEQKEDEYAKVILTIHSNYILAIYNDYTVARVHNLRNHHYVINIKRSNIHLFSHNALISFSKMTVLFSLVYRQEIKNDICAESSVLINDVGCSAS